MNTDRKPTRPLSRFAVLVLGLLLALPLAVAAEAAAAEGPDAEAGISDSSQRSARSTRSSSSSRSSSASSSSRSSSSSKGTATRRSGSSSASRGSSGARSTRPPAGSSGRTVVDVDRRPAYGGHRGHRSPYHYGYHHYPYYRYGGYAGFYWPWFYGTWYWPGYYPYRYGYGGPVYVYSDPGEGLGALDLDVRPEKAEVWINGQYIGVCDRYDGFPSYLWLPEGTYDFVFYKEGFETIARQYTVYPGLIIDVEDAMRPGEAVRPEALVAQSTERRDQRLEANRERRIEAGRAAPGRAAPSAGGPLDARGEPGLLSVRITPEDASVYLDGRFLGSASELAGLHAGLMVDAGEHRLEVVRPGYAAEEVVFEIEAGEEVAVEVDLEES